MAALAQGAVFSGLGRITQMVSADGMCESGEGRAEGREQEYVTESLSSPDRVLWPLADHLQTTRDLSDHAGQLREHYQYDSFGQILSGDTSLTRFLFTAREHDPATSLNYHRARHYDPAPGRWLSEDPLEFAAGDPNLNAYVGNGPTLASDPSGHQVCPQPFKFVPPSQWYPGQPISTTHVYDADAYFKANYGFMYWFGEETTTFKIYKQGCVGLCKLHVYGGSTMPTQPEKAFGARAFFTLEHALADLKMRRTQENSSRMMLFAIQTNYPPSPHYPGPWPVEQLHPHSIQYGDVNYLTLFQPAPDQRTWFWEGMNHSYTLPDPRVIITPFAGPLPNTNYKYTFYLTVPGTPGYSSSDGLPWVAGEITPAP